MNKIAGLLVSVFLVAVTLTWDAPTTNTDGSPLTDLGGYKLYCGSSVGTYAPIRDVGNVLEYPISNDLADGTHHCVATAYDTSGNESAYSTEVVFPLDRVGPGAPVNLRLRF